jgi:uncharacterized DUF497 family protein
VAYEWDPAKAQINAAKHGVRFNDVVSALEDDRALTRQDLTSEDEERWITIGRDMLGRVVVVIYTWRFNSARLISARLATRSERKQYLENP